MTTILVVLFIKSWRIWCTMMRLSISLYHYITIVILRESVDIYWGLVQVQQCSVGDIWITEKVIESIERMQRR